VNGLTFQSFIKWKAEHLIYEGSTPPPQINLEKKLTTCLPPTQFDGHCE